MWLQIDVSGFKGVTMDYQTHEPTFSLHLNFVESAFSPEQRAGFQAIVLELLGLAVGAREIQHLTGLLVVPDSAIERTVNALIRKYMGKERGAYRRRPGDLGGGVAVPLEQSGKLSCYVIIGANLLANVTEEHNHAFPLVSRVLEEFLHVRLYAMVWESAGGLGLLAKPSGCLSELRSLCHMAHDEYIVPRWKAGVLGSIPLVEVDGVLCTTSLYHPHSLAEEMEQAKLRLVKIVSRAARGYVSVEESFTQLMQCLYRDIFEHLVRDAGLRAGNRDALAGQEVANGVSDTPTPANAPRQNADESAFYREYVATVWAQLRREIEHSYETDFGGHKATLSTMVAIVRRFLETVGVTLTEQPDGECFVVFDTRTSPLYRGMD